MAGFSEPEDAYAADGEGSASHFKRQRSSIRNRDPGPHLASRLRQRPPTKHEAASEVPRSSPAEHRQKTQHHQHFQHLQHQQQPLPTPTRHRPHDDFRSQPAASSRSYLLDDDDDDDQDEEYDDLPPQLHAPLPLSPHSPPRRAIGSSSNSTSILFDPVATPTPAASYAGAAIPTSPVIPPKHSSRADSGSSATTTTTTTSSRNPGLSTQP